MDDIAKLITQSIRKSRESIDLQKQARDLAEDSGDEDAVHFVSESESLIDAIEEAEEDDIIIVSPHNYTESDVVINKGIQLIGASIKGLVDVQADDVTLIGCKIKGPHESGALISTGHGLTVQNCILQGSDNGQHRGIHVRSHDVTIIDTNITGIYKLGQEAQAIGGWDGVAHLLVERCHLEAAGENFMLGGADSSSEEEMPYDITIRDCVLTKPLSWRNMGYSVKNIFELKTVRKFLMENCLLEYSWVEGQTGFAMVINVRNQDGTAPWSTIEDVVIRNCTIRHCAGGIQFLGTDYTHPSQMMKRVSIEDCVFEDISPEWGANQRCLQFSQGGEDISFINNQFSGKEIASFMIFEGTPLTRMLVTGNRFPEGYYGIKSDDMAIGTATLEKYAPECEWANNIVVRTEPNNNYPYPEGTTIVSE